MNEKKSLRVFFKEKINKISDKRKIEAKQQITEILWPALSVYKFVLSFYSKQNEINLIDLNTNLSKEKRLLLPRVSGDTLCPYIINNIHSDLILSKWNILEPDPKIHEKIDIDKIDCAIIPALGFDKYNHRLGYGKGYYDKLITALSKNKPCFGVGFREQLIEDPLPIQPHDKKLTKIFLF